MNKRHYEHTLPNIRGSLSNTYEGQGSLLLFGVNNQRNTFFLLFTFQWTEMNGLIIWIGQCFIFLF